MTESEVKELYELAEGIKLIAAKNDSHLITKNFDNTSFDYFKADLLGFEVVGEFATYHNAFENLTSLMSDHCSSCCLIWNRNSGESPYKVMVIPYNRNEL